MEKHPDMRAGLCGLIDAWRWPGVVVEATGGLVLPAATGILPWLTPLAAAGFTIIMAGAVVFHLRRQETSQAIASAVLAILAAFVDYMRWQVIPF